MKTLSEYLALPYHMEIIEDHDESGYVASFPELHGCLSCGETVSDAIANAMDAKRTWLEAAEDAAFRCSKRLLFGYIIIAKNRGTVCPQK